MGHRPMGSVDDQIKHLSKKLNLTDDQQAKLKPILEDQRKQMEAIHSDSSLSREDRFSKMQALRQSSDAQIKSVLNEEQQKNFDKMRAEQQERMKQWRKGGDNALLLRQPAALRTVRNSRRRPKQVFSQASGPGNSFASPARVDGFRGSLFWCGASASLVLKRRGSVGGEKDPSNLLFLRLLRERGARAYIVCGISHIRASRLLSGSRKNVIHRS